MVFAFIRQDTALVIKENMNELTRKHYRSEGFIDYKADMEQPLSMIYQRGYPTIKDNDMRWNRFLLDFPNNEVKRGFLTVFATSYLQPKNVWKNG